MVQTKEDLSTDVAASGVTAASISTTQTRAPRRLLASPLSGRASQIAAQVAPRASRRRQSGHFLLHYFEMCAPMCVGFAVGDLIYFWAAGLLGYSEPFRQLPELSVMVVTFAMTAPMTAWMLFRGMPRRPTAEMSAVMPALAIVLLAVGWLAIVPLRHQLEQPPRAVGIVAEAVWRTSPMLWPTGSSSRVRAGRGGRPRRPVPFVTSPSR